MNIIAGMMMPETNWAPKLASYSSSFLAANGASTSRWRPKTLTSSWPVKASSIWRVERAGVRPLRDEQLLRALGDLRVTSTDSGIVTSAIDGEQRRDHEHHHQHADHREQRGEQLAQRLLQALGDVVDVVGDPAEQLAARLPVEVGQRQPVELVLDVGAQPEDGALHDVVEQVALQPSRSSDAAT